jgi:hypothetical protein
MLCLKSRVLYALWITLTSFASFLTLYAFGLELAIYYIARNAALNYRADGTTVAFGAVPFLTLAAVISLLGGLILGSISFCLGSRRPYGSGGYPSAGGAAGEPVQYDIKPVDGASADITSLSPAADVLDTSTPGKSNE